MLHNSKNCSNFAPDFGRVIFGTYLKGFRRKRSRMGTKTPKKGTISPQKDHKLLKISYNLAVRLKFAAKIRKNINSTKFLDNKIKLNNKIMAQLLNFRSNSPVRVGRKVKKIVSQISSLIDKFPSRCWYDGRWYFGGNGPQVYETECRGIHFKEDGVLFLFDDPYGQTHGRILPYGPKLYSRLKLLRKLIWVSPDYHTKKDAPAWALRWGANYR